MKEIRTEIEIQSSLQIAWKILTDFPGYDQWNPVIIRMTGIPRLGEKLVIRLRTQRGKVRTYRPVITKLEENHELRWKGTSFIPGFLIGERVFTFDQVTNNQIRLLHAELFSGLAANLGGSMLTKNVEPSLHEMNIAFKKKAEEESKIH
jgi:hypothetical protein